MLTGEIWPSGDFSVGSVPYKIAQTNDTEDPVRVSEGGQAHKRGRAGMTSYGRKMTRSAASWMETFLGTSNLTFGTATLPELSESALQKICISWGEITRQFFQSLVRLLEKKGLSSHYVQVSEIQEKRFSETGQPYPHLHWIMQGRSHRYEHWRIKPQEVRELWNRIISNFLGSKISSLASTRIESIRSSSMSYLSKYMSKGGELVEKIAEQGIYQLPTAWYGVDLPLKQHVKQHIRKLDSNHAAIVFDNRVLLKELGVIWYKDVEIEIVEHSTNATFKHCVGCYGSILDWDSFNNFLESYV